MSVIISDAASVCNYALAKVGYPLRIGSLYDGSKAAKICLDVYGQTRDALFLSGDMDFVERTIVATLLKQAPASYIVTPWTPAYPQLPWLYEYTYPDDAIRIRSVKFQTISLPNFDPRYNRFSIVNDDTYSPSQKVVLCDVPHAILVYAGQVTDPGAWDEAYIDFFADKLGLALAPSLMGLESAKLVAAEASADKMAAEASSG